MNSAHSPVRVLPLLESRFGLDGGAMFGIIPRPLWHKTNPADAQNRIDMTCRCLLVEYPDRRVLIDVGLGTRWSERERDRYAIRDQDDGLSTALAALGLSAHDITDVVLTHLHFDHAGGLVTTGEDGAPRPVFERATHWVQRRNWAWAHAPSARDAGSYRLEDFSIFEAPDAPTLELLDGIAEPLPGLEVLPHHGHTPGMQVVKVTTPEHTFAFVADLIPTTSHLRDPWVMGYDLEPLITVQEKRALLYEAMRHDWILCFEHDPHTPLARIERDERGRPRAVPVTLPGAHA